MISDFIILTDSFTPKRNSAARMLEELSLEYSHNYKVCVLTEDSTLKTFYQFEKQSKNLSIIRIKVLRRSESNALRGIAELINPYIMLLIIQFFGLKQFLQTKKLIWYSPTIFYTPLIKFIKNLSDAKTYLILRDIFPEWAIDLELIKRNSLIHKILSFFEKRQYALADHIGVQIETNIKLVKRQLNQDKDIHVLNNWKSINKSILRKSPKINHQMRGIYAGNLGIAQGIDNTKKLIELSIAKNFSIDFFSSGEHFDRLVEEYQNFDNVSFFSEIPPDDLENGYCNYDFGIVLLDLNHTTNNIPGKFISYVSNALPSLCILNPNNPLIDIINTNMLGIATSSNDLNTLKNIWDEFLENLERFDYFESTVQFAIRNYDVKTISLIINAKLEE